MRPPRLFSCKSRRKKKAREWIYNKNRVYGQCCKGDDDFHFKSLPSIRNQGILASKNYDF